MGRFEGQRVLKPARLYVPERGDAVWLDFDPQAGREQAGRRPALVLSDATYKRKSGLALFCPITSQSKGYPFETKIPERLPLQGVVLSDQVRSLDYRCRRAKFIFHFPTALTEDVLAKVAALLELDA